MVLQTPLSYVFVDLKVRNLQTIYVTNPTNL